MPARRVLLSIAIACGLVGCGRLAFESGSASAGDDGGAGDDASGPTMPCTEGDQRLEANGHCYSEWNQRVTYVEAVTACAAFGAHLATIGDADEDNAVLATLTDVAWIGLTDRATEGTFAWDDGEPLGYTRWADGEPNDSGGGEDCTEMRNDDSWNDVSCGELDRYICERENLATTCTMGDARVEVDGHCYWRVNTPVTWSAAELACSQVPGATLASILDAETNRVLSALRAQNFWIGGTDSSSEGTFSWSNGDAFGFTQWASQEPNGGINENCIEVTDPGWNDAMCSDEMIAYVCEHK